LFDHCRGAGRSRILQRSKIIAEALQISGGAPEREIDPSAIVQKYIYLFRMDNRPIRKKGGIPYE
jgi:hypothetical protein